MKERRVYINTRTQETFTEEGTNVIAQQLAWLIHKESGDSFYGYAVSLETGEILREWDWN